MSKRDDTDDKLQISQNIVRIFCVSYLTAGQTIDNLSSSILSIPHRLKKYAACDLPSEFSAKTDNEVQGIYSVQKLFLLIFEIDLYKTRK